MAQRHADDLNGARAMPALFDESARDYDAVLIVSFGGPEGPDDVTPFLDNVLRGLPIRPESRAAIEKRYQDFGGVSPINAELRRFIKALNTELEKNGPAVPVYWGNRNWHPMLSDTLRQMRDDGVRSAIAFVTSMFSSYSGCRRYREDLYSATEGLENAPGIDKLRLGFNHPLFIEAVADRLGDALSRSTASGAQVLFTAHSLPEPMADACRYREQLMSACGLVAGELGIQDWQLVYQSNNASYGGPAWLGPDISEALRDARARGTSDVVVMPIGFVCDHLEVVIDLDVEAAALAEEIGMNMIRAATVGTHPAYVRMVRDLIIERMSEAPQRAVRGTLGASYDYCPADCCLSGRAVPLRPALCGADSRESTQ